MVIARRWLRRLAGAGVYEAAAPAWACAVDPEDDHLAISVRPNSVVMQYKQNASIYTPALQCSVASLFACRDRKAQWPRYFKAE